jgi:Maltokinase N-terminal cap domain
MAIIHKTTLIPSKLELLTAWLPAQPWYLDRGRAPELAKAGGFRLDDPAGEVGIEFMVVTDGQGDEAAAYLVPMTYRASALPGADNALIGTTEHGVLGHRWIYDGTHDPVLVTELVALIQGEAEAQAQSVNNTPDPTVTVTPVIGGCFAATESEIRGNGPSGTDLHVETADTDGIGRGQLLIRIGRVLKPEGDTRSGEGQPRLSATWQLPDGTRVRGILATAQYAQTPGQ